MRLTKNTCIALKQNDFYNLRGMKTKLLLPIFLFLITHSNSCAQSDTIPLRENRLYIEAGGLGGYGSLNYERAFARKQKWDIVARFGISTYNLRDFTDAFNPDIIIPISIIGLYGTTHHLEVGIGQTIASIIQTNQTSWKPERTADIHAHFSLGYRYQKEHGGTIFRLSYTPIIEYYKYFRNWGGISIGRAF